MLEFRTVKPHLIPASHELDISSRQFYWFSLHPEITDGSGVLQEIIDANGVLLQACTSTPLVSGRREYVRLLYNMYVRIVLLVFQLVLNIFLIHMACLDYNLGMLNPWNKVWTIYHGRSWSRSCVVWALATSGWPGSVDCSLPPPRVSW